MTQLVDVHAHLETLKDLNIILLRAKEAGISKIITCGSSLEWSRKCVELSEADSNLVEIFACCGIHPQDGKDEVVNMGDKYLGELRDLVNSSNKVVAIGECGFDFYLPGEKLYKEVNKDADFQEELFINQIKLADELKKPIVIHCRNGWDKLLTILEANKNHLGKSGMFHSWTGSMADAKRAIALGFYISFSGIVTFKNAGEIVDVAKWAPKDRILVETDSPFLTPIPFRGKQNEPKNVKITAQFLAQLRGESLEIIAETTTQNAETLFGI